MNLHWIDWSIVVGIFVILLSIAFVAKRYTASVADFLAANRCAGRYLLTISEGAGALGLISIVAYWELYYKAGFSALWWYAMVSPIMLIISLSGWIAYRYRETRAMTMAQFFEIRYSRKFRVFCGILACFSGVLNYGIFPAVTSRCLIYFCGIPVYEVNVCGLSLNITMAIVMFIMLGIALIFTFMGGQISVMLTDFFQGQLFNIVFVTLFIILITKIGWSHIIEVLQNAPGGKSMLNPFDQKDLSEFNVWYFVTYTFMVVYGYRAWQGTQGYSCSAKSPHETRMANILASWRQVVTSMVLVICPIGVYVVLHSPQFSELAQDIQATLNTINDPTIREQVTVATGLTKILPIGMVGMLAAALIAAGVSTDDTYLHSWGSIFVQDVVLPFRKKSFTAKEHLRWLRFSILGVAMFAWTFSMLFPLKDYIFMFFQITGAIYLGGAGAVIIGGLYWKRATTAGAWTGMITGCVLSVSGIVLKNFLWPLLPKLQSSYPGWIWLEKLPVEFPLNGIQMAFCAAIIAASFYILVSLFTKPDPDFNMDRMLHRGKYAIKGEHEPIEIKQRKLYRILGIGKEFSKGDKIIYLATMVHIMFWFFTFIIGTILYLMFGATDDTWSKWWLFKMVFTVVLGVVVVVWFIWGGIRDLKDLFISLKAIKCDAADDGTVENHQNVVDSKLTEN